MNSSDTAALKNFATRARTDLIREVGARLDAVLAPYSSVSTEQPRAFAALNRALTEHGRDAIVDRVAYAWFNRIIALRFMDANGYTGVGVVSPEAGKDSGQPQVLSESKGGDFDTDVVDEKMRVDITALLDGTRTSSDSQGEAYGLLLEAYCRFWNKSMPFMFEREGDYTELLMPTGLLAGDSVRDRAVRVMTVEICAEVEVIGWLYQFYISERKDEVFAGFRRNKKAGAAEIPAATQLFTPHWIVRYLVENSLGRLWLQNHPESQLASQMEYYIAPVDEETDFLRIGSPEELKIIDPAAGSGHMLTYAFDLLYAIYEEESYSPSEIPAKILEYNLFGVEIDPRAGALAAFALTMKAAGKRKLFLKSTVQPNITVLENVHFEQDDLEYLWSLSRGISVQRSDFDAFWNAFEHADTFGSLIQPNERLIPLLAPIVERLEVNGSLLGRPARRLVRQATHLAATYAVAIVNPPYMGNKSMDEQLSKFAADRYPDSKLDLFAMFIERALSLTASGGSAALVTMQSWMFLKSYRALRQRVLERTPPVTMGHFGTNAFDTISGEVVSTTAFVLSRGDSSRRGQYFDLRAGRSESAKSASLRAATASGQFQLVSADDLIAIDGAPIAYFLSDAMRRAFLELPQLASQMKAAVGLNTGDNDRFLRLWQEVSIDQVEFAATTLDDAGLSGKTWFPYNKGGGHRKWYGNHHYLINWNNDGRELKAYGTIRNSGRHWSRYIQNLDVMLKEAVTWSDITTQSFAARYSPAGFFFDVKGSSGFPVRRDLLGQVLAVMCSTFMTEFMGALNPSTTFQVGDMARVPFATAQLALGEPSELLPVRYAREDWDDFETSWNFRSSPLPRLALHHASGSLVSVRELLEIHRRQWAERTQGLLVWERSLNQELGVEYGLPEADVILPTEFHISLSNNPAYRFGNVGDPAERERLQRASDVRDLISFAVGTMFGRYSLDEPGLILANQGDTLQQYLEKVPNPTFRPDDDNVIPIVDGEWFKDDIVGRFRQFLRTAFGEERFEENLRFVVDSLGVKDLRDYFVKAFYKDHIQRYKKRPIYWLFSSPKNSFSALMYLHRYTPSTVSTVLNEYLREFIKKLEVERDRLDFVVASGADAKTVAAAQKEADRLRKVLIELDEYERELHTLASQQITLDLDDGVLVNYQKFGSALRDIGLKKGGADD